MTNENPFMALPKADASANPFMDVPMEEPAEESRTLSEKVWRGIKLGVRYPAETPALVAAGLSDLAAGGMNYVLQGVDTALQVAGDKPIGYQFPTNRAQTVYEGFNRITGVEPESRAEKYAENISRGVTMAGMNIGAGTAMANQAASPVTRGVGEVMTKAPAGQAATTATGVAGATRAQEAGYGPTGQMVAGVATGSVPAIVRAGVPAAVRGTLRGGESGRQTLASNIDDFAIAGTEPTLAQGTQGRVAQAAEGGLSRAPGSAGRIAQTAESQADDIAAGLEQKASQLAGKTSAERAGRAITEGITGKRGFVERFRAKQKELYDNLEKIVKPRTKVSVQNTAETLDEMTGLIGGAPNTSEAISNPALRRIYDALYDDLLASADGRLPFRALKELRSKVGVKVSTVGLTDDISKAEWKRLYGALSKDMQAAVAETQSPQAQQAWARANMHTRAGHKRIEVIESALKRKGGPEKVFAAAMSGTKEGATVLRSVMQSLSLENQKILTATVLRRMGLARPGGQNALGDKFSTEVFLTNWSSLSKEAKRTLFSRYGAQFQDDMDAVARVAANLREGSQVFRNPSGTAQAATQNYTVGAFGLAVITGQFETAAGIAAGVGALNLSARLMTSPTVVHWLARTSTMPPSQLPSQIAILEKQAASTKDEDLALLAVILKEANQ
jgi:hypothetical protein